ncbi:MAG: hypothetical protein K2P83_03360 [Nitrosomonas sp.]|nr:hypothetical protein [Nitrosomonas sp.]
MNLLKDPVTTPHISNRMPSLISIDLYSGLAGSSTGLHPKIMVVPPSSASVRISWAPLA